MNNTGRLLTWGATGLVVLFLLIYGIYEARNLILGPHIDITSPIDGSTATSSLVTIIGSTRNTTALFINDREVFIDINHNFSEPITLTPGYAIIAVVGKDRFKREVKKEIRLIYSTTTESRKKPPPPIDPNPQPDKNQTSTSTINI